MPLETVSFRPLALPAIDGARLVFANGRYVVNRSSTAVSAGMQISMDEGDVCIDITAGSEATIVETYAGEDESAYTTQAKTRIVLGDGARLTHYKLVRESPQATHHSFLEVDVRSSAVFDSHVFLWGGAQVRHTLQVRLAG